VVPAEEAIRARRKLTNRLIARHDAESLRPFFTPDVNLIAGDGGLLMGVDAVVSAFAGQFADSDFQTYLRETETVAIDVAGERAAETGRWTASYRNAQQTGTYLAVWRKVRGQWVIESELFVTLLG
jgi:ketosteroid isomerase-like protein